MKETNNNAYNRNPTLTQLIISFVGYYQRINYIWRKGGGAHWGRGVLIFFLLDYAHRFHNSTLIKVLLERKMKIIFQTVFRLYWLFLTSKWTHFWLFFLTFWAAYVQYSRAMCGEKRKYLKSSSKMTIYFCPSTSNAFVFQECPTGVVTEEKFREIYDRFFPYGSK